MVVRDGGVASPREARARRRAITERRDAPRAHWSSASRRSCGHEYEPGRRRGGGPVRCLSSRSRCTSSARRRRAVKHPAARHTWLNDTEKSRPARERWNSRDRWAAQSHTETPPGRTSCARSPRPRPMQIAHGGRDPNRSPLYKLLATDGGSPRRPPRITPDPSRPRPTGVPPHVPNGTRGDAQVGHRDDPPEGQKPVPSRVLHRLVITTRERPALPGLRRRWGDSPRQGRLPAHALRSDRVPRWRGHAAIKPPTRSPGRSSAAPGRPPDVRGPRSTNPGGRRRTAPPPHPRRLSR
jgi:hypothetical protein